jgi:hypothetical protein
VRRTLIAASVVTVSVSTVTACGSHSNEPSIGPAARTVGTISDGGANEPIIRDIAALRKAADAGRSDEAIRALYDLLTAAQSLPNDREGWKGAALIRARLPQIVRRFLSDYARTRGRLSRVPTLTPGGAAIKAWLLGSYESQRRELLQLRADVAGNTYAWGAVLRWEGTNNAAVAESDNQLRSILHRLPLTQRQTADRAIRQTSGH